MNDSNFFSLSLLHVFFSKIMGCSAIAVLKRRKKTQAVCVYIEQTVNEFSYILINIQLPNECSTVTTVHLFLLLFI